MGLRACISGKLPDGTDAAGPGTTLGVGLRFPKGPTAVFQKSAL